MFGQVVWWSSIVLEVLLLLRAGQQKLASKFPLFYTYIGVVLLVDLFRFYVYEVQPGYYAPCYWATEFLTAVVSYGVVLEIYKRSLISHPGVARLSQTVLYVVWILTLTYVAAGTLSAPHGSWISASAELGRDLRYVQAVLLVLILALFGHYQIPAGRNLRGLTWGYGFFVGSSIIDVAIRSQRGNGLSVVIRELHPLLYLSTLVIWSVALWSQRPEPQSQVQAEIDHDYRALAAQTKLLLERAFSYVVRSIRT